MLYITVFSSWFDCIVSFLHEKNVICVQIIGRWIHSSECASSVFFIEMNYLMSCCQVDDVDVVECAAKSLTWATISESVSLDDKLTLTAVVVMMLVDAVLYMAIALVIEKMQHSGQSFRAFLLVSIVFLRLSLNFILLN